MINRYEYEGIVWIDIENPTADEIGEVAQEFNLGPLLSQELLAPTLKPRVDLYPEIVYALLHFPARRHTHNARATQEVDFVIGKHFVITVHYDTVDALIDFARSFEAAMLLKRSVGKFHSGHILFELTQRLYQEVEYELDSLEDSIGAIENAIFSGHEKDMVLAISRISRELIDQKRTLSMHTEVLAALEHAGVSLFGDNFANYLRGISAFHYRTHQRALSLMDTITELRNTNDSLLTTRQNEITKNLTIMAFITFPLSLIAALFGMNTENTPVANTPNGFWVITGSMLVITALFFLYFKIKKWF
ncbi:MAG: CorA family divalent cation transporter [Patescibacteria group bacterium]